MARVYNFSAGPSVLPESVLRQAADEMLDYQGSGQSVMEMSHRSAAFEKLPDSVTLTNASSCFKFISMPPSHFLRLSSLSP